MAFLMDMDDADSSDDQLLLSALPSKHKPLLPSIDDPNYFEELSPEEIYDSFFSIRRMGFIANRIIRKLNETKHIVSSKILEKRKKLKALQRKQFEQLSPAGAEYLKVLLKIGENNLKF
jgi:DNA polymerase III alpha subunit